MNPSLSQVINQAAARRNSPLWIVGGPVRDALLGRPCDDWDMVARGAEKIARSVAKSLGAKFITLDEQHEIYRVIVPSSGLRPPSPTLPREKGIQSFPLARREAGEGARRAGEGPLTLDFAELQGRTIEEDLKRRDFTINAMAMLMSSFRRKPESSALDWTPASAGVTDLIDPCGGRRDLKRKIIRAVSASAFQTDPLRLVRAFRFAAQFQFTIEPRTLRLIKKYRLGLSKVAAERVREELLRLWKHPRSSVALRLMDRVRLLAGIFPEIEACRRTAVGFYGKGGVLKHSFETVENLEWILEGIASERRGIGASGKRLIAPTLRGTDAPVLTYLNHPIGGYPRHAWLKFAAFLHDVGKPSTAKLIKGRLRFFEHEHVGAEVALRIGQRLRCSRQESHLLGLWVRNHMRTGNLAAASRITDKALSRFFRDLGEEGVGMVLLSLADHYTYLSKARWGKGTDSVEKMSRQLLSSYYEERSKILPARVLTGHDVMRRFKLKPGPLIGQLLAKIQDAQAEGKVQSREEAFTFLKKELLRRHTGEGRYPERR